MKDVDWLCQYQKSLSPEIKHSLRGALDHITQGESHKRPILGPTLPVPSQAMPMAHSTQCQTTQDCSSGGGRSMDVSCAGSDRLRAKILSILSASTEAVLACMSPSDHQKYRVGALPLGLSASLQYFCVVCSTGTSQLQSSSVVT